VYGDAALVRSQPQLIMEDTDTGEDSWAFRSDGGVLNLLRLDDARNQIADPVLTIREHSHYSSFPGSEDEVSVAFNRDVRADGWLMSRIGVRLVNESPEVRFRETGVAANNWRYKMMLNNELLDIYANRDDNESGALDPIDGGPLLRLHSSSTRDATPDYASFSNQVRAVEFCNQGGTTCLTIDEIAARLP
jgi:hypothetical protein